MSSTTAKILSAAAASACVATGFVGFQVLTAHASDTCSSNRVCIYGNANYKGKQSERSPGNGLINVPLSINDQMSSWRNITNVNAAWYDSSDGRGGCHTMALASSNSHVNIFDEDSLSSWRTDRGC